MSRTIEYEHFECANCHATLSALKPVIHEEIPKCSKCLKHWWVPTSLKWVDDHKTEGKYIDFFWTAWSRTGKTKQWIVQNRENQTVLGHITWFGRWRKYAFVPYENMVFEETCMRDISQFIQQETAYHRKAASRRKAAGA